MKKLAVLKSIQKLKKKHKKMGRVQRFLLGVVSLGVILILLFFLYTLYLFATAKDVAQVLPAEKTTAYVEINELNISPKLSQSSLTQADFLQSYLETFSGLNLEEAFVKWAGTPVGVAVIDTGNAQEPVLFVRSKSRSAGVNFFKDLALEEEELIKEKRDGFSLFSFSESQPFSFTFVNNYMFASKSGEALKAIIDSQDTEDGRLIDKPEFRSSLGNLPRRPWLHGYVNVQNISLNTGNPAKSLFEPLQWMADHIAISVRQDHNGFHFNNYMALNQEYLALKPGYREDTRFAYGLTEFIGSENVLAYVGGANLAAEWQNTLETISNLNPSYGVILEGLLRAQVSNVFGRDIDLRDDLYPLFEGEYALALKQNEDGSLGIKLIVGHDNDDFAEAKLDKLFNGFRLLAAQFAPKLEVFILPDGTESAELVADPDRFAETIEEYRNFEIPCLEGEGTTYGFCYLIMNDMIVMANSLDEVKEAIDLSFSPKNVLSQSQQFRKTLSNLSKVSDEITFIEFNHLEKAFEASPYNFFFKPFVEPFDAVTWVKHYFDDGVSTEGYLLLK